MTSIFGTVGQVRMGTRKSKRVKAYEELGEAQQAIEMAGIQIETLLGRIKGYKAESLWAFLQRRYFR